LRLAVSISPLGADPLEAHDELELEIGDGVNARPSPFGVPLGDPLVDKRQVELRLQMPMEVVCRDKLREGDGDRFVQAAG
jgi:hypothetical protein